MDLCRTCGGVRGAFHSIVGGCQCGTVIPMVPDECERMAAEVIAEAAKHDAELALLRRAVAALMRERHDHLGRVWASFQDDEGAFTLGIKLDEGAPSLTVQALDEEATP